MSTSGTEGDLQLAIHGRGNLKQDELDRRIAEVWAQTLGSDAGRQEMASILGVRPQDLGDGPSPIVIDAEAGFDLTLLYVVAKWTATTIIVPVLVDLAKDELKKRLTRLWKEVLLPAIRASNEDAIGD